MANVLVVDDEEAIRTLLSDVLQDEGHCVILAENATQARQCVIESLPDLALLDIWMPDTDGLSLLREWRVSWSKQNKMQMPVLMMSGHASQDLVSDALKIGAVGFLEKPITLNALRSAVQNALSSAKEAVQVPSPSPLPATGVLPPTNAAYVNLNLNQPFRQAKEQFEQAYLRYQAQRFDTMRQLAEFSGMERTYLYRKMKNLGIDKN